MHTRTLALAALLAMIAGCGNKTVLTRTSQTRDDPIEGEVRSEGTAVSFEDQTRLRFDEAAALVRERDFDGAIAIYRNLYQHSPASEDRATALLRWASAEGHLLNPSKDLDAATARLELLLEEFPSSARANEARRELDRLRGLADRD